MKGKNGFAYCGLYCGGCGRYKKGRWKRCRDDGGYDSCKIRKCAKDRGYFTCAECGEFLECKKLDNFISKIFSFLFKSDRVGNLKEIKGIGVEKWSTQQAKKAK